MPNKKTQAVRSARQAMQKYRREIKEQIEKALHPCLTVDGVTILHEHRGGKIVFSAWKGDSPCNDRSFSVDRMVVLNTTHFYLEYAEDIDFLLDKVPGKERQ